MEQLTEKYEQIMEKYIKLKMEHENLIQVKKKKCK
jgi:hypothetical protein